MPYITSPFVREYLCSEGYDPDSPEVASKLAAAGWYIGEQPSEGLGGNISAFVQGAVRTNVNTGKGLLNLLPGVSMEETPPSPVEQANPIAGGLGQAAGMVPQFLVGELAAVKLLSKVPVTAKILSAGRVADELASAGKGIAAARSLAGAAVDESTALSILSEYGGSIPFQAPNILSGFTGAQTAARALRAGAAGAAIGGSQPGTIEERMANAVEMGKFGAAFGALGAPVGLSRPQAALREAFGGAISPPMGTDYGDPLGHAGGALFGGVMGALTGGRVGPRETRTGVKPKPEDRAKSPGRKPGLYSDALWNQDTAEFRLDLLGKRELIVEAQKADPSNPIYEETLKALDQVLGGNPDASEQATVAAQSIQPDPLPSAPVVEAFQPVPSPEQPSRPGEVQAAPPASRPTLHRTLNPETQRKRGIAVLSERQRQIMEGTLTAEGDAEIEWWAGKMEEMKATAKKRFDEAVDIPDDDPRLVGKGGERDYRFYTDEMNGETLPLLGATKSGEKENTLWLTDGTEIYLKKEGSKDDWKPSTRGDYIRSELNSHMGQVLGYARRLLQHDHAELGSDEDFMKQFLAVVGSKINEMDQFKAYSRRLYNNPMVRPGFKKDFYHAPVKSVMGSFLSERISPDMLKKMGDLGIDAEGVSNIVQEQLRVLSPDEQEARRALFTAVVQHKEVTDPLMIISLAKVGESRSKGSGRVHRIPASISTEGAANILSGGYIIDPSNAVRKAKGWPEMEREVIDWTRKPLGLVDQSALVPTDPIVQKMVEFLDLQVEASFASDGVDVLRLERSERNAWFQDQIEGELRRKGGKVLFDGQPISPAQLDLALQQVVGDTPNEVAGKTALLFADEPSASLSERSKKAQTFLEGEVEKIPKGEFRPSNWAEWIYFGARMGIDLEVSKQAAARITENTPWQKQQLALGKSAKLKGLPLDEEVRAAAADTALASHQLPLSAEGTPISAQAVRPDLPTGGEVIQKAQNEGHQAAAESRGKAVKLNDLLTRLNEANRSSGAKRPDPVPRVKADETVRKAMAPLIKAERTALHKISKLLTQTNEALRSSQKFNEEKGKLPSSGRLEKGAARIDKYQQDLIKMQEELRLAKENRKLAQARFEGERLRAANYLSQKIESYALKLQGKQIGERMKQAKTRLRSIVLLRALKNVGSPGLSTEELVALPRRLQINHVVQRLLAPENRKWSRLHNTADYEGTRTRFLELQRFMAAIPEAEQQEVWPTVKAYVDGEDTSTRAIARLHNSKKGGFSVNTPFFGKGATEGHVIITDSVTHERYDLPNPDSAAMLIDILAGEQQRSPDFTPPGITFALDLDQGPSGPAIHEDSGRTPPDVAPRPSKETVEDRDSEPPRKGGPPDDGEGGVGGGGEREKPTAHGAAGLGDFIDRHIKIWTQLIPKISREIRKVEPIAHLADQIEPISRRLDLGGSQAVEKHQQFVENLAKKLKARGLYPSASLRYKLAKAASDRDSMASTVQMKQERDLMLAGVEKVQARDQSIDYAETILPEINEEIRSNHDLSDAEFDYLTVDYDEAVRGLFKDLELTSRFHVGYYTRARFRSNGLSTADPGASEAELTSHDFTVFDPSENRYRKVAQGEALRSDDQITEIAAEFGWLDEAGQPQIDDFFATVQGLARRAYRWKYQGEALADLQGLINEGKPFMDTNMQFKLLQFLRRNAGIPAESELARRSARGVSNLKWARRVKNLTDGLDGEAHPKLVSGLTNFYKRLSLNVVTGQSKAAVDRYNSAHRRSIFGLHPMRAMRDFTVTAAELYKRHDTASFVEGMKILLTHGDDWVAKVEKLVDQGLVSRDDYMRMEQGDPFLHPLATRAEKIGSWMYRSQDRMIRVAGAEISRISTEKAYKRWAETGRYEDFIEITGLDTHDPIFYGGMQRGELEGLLRQGDLGELTRRVARVHENGTIFRFTLTHAPGYYDTAVGRFLGLYGSWPVNAINSMWQLTQAPLRIYKGIGKPGEEGYIPGDTTRALRRSVQLGMKAAIAAEAMYAAGAYLNVDTSQWIPFLHNLGYTGGPGFSVIDEIRDFTSDPTTRARWEKEPRLELARALRSYFVPLPGYDILARRMLSQTGAFRAGVLEAIAPVFGGTSDQAASVLGLYPEMDSAWDRFIVGAGFTPFVNNPKVRKDMLQKFGGAAGRFTQDVIGSGSASAVPEGSEEGLESGTFKPIVGGD